MDIIQQSKGNKAFETQAKAEVLSVLEPVVEKLIGEHLKTRRLWFSSDFLPSDEQIDEDGERDLLNLRERARGIKDGVRVSIALNLITEEGLPHFHRIISNYLGNDNSYSKWNFLWTAEEDRHGCIIRDYARETRLFNFRQLEGMQYAYLEAGFAPEWDNDPYKVFVYTTLQERATHISHRKTGELAGEEEPLLKDILKNVATDESKHFTFYLKTFKAILDIDPNRALQSAATLMPGIDMPGLMMPHFKEMGDIVRRIGIYDPWDYKKIVEIVTNFWGIDKLSGLNPEGRQAQEKIMNLPKRLQKVAEYIQQRTVKKSFTFDFLYNRAIDME
jgi:acyl-[acyl-carrier-protein] desaturase